jgi:hypothetical protein
MDSGKGHEQPSFAAPLTVPAGTKCKILLLNNVSASKSKSGDVVQGRLLEPVILDSQVVLPAGSLFEGEVLKTVPPRWLSRSGSMYLAFTELNILDGNRVPVAASITGAEIDQKSHTRIDAEGRMRADKPGAAWMLLNAGASYGMSKVADDATQLIVEALISTATDASTAGLARIVSTGVSGVFMVSRHGRDVVLPKFTEMNIMLDRPLNLSSRPEPSAATTSVIGD